jgi:putative chitinase
VLTPKLIKQIAPPARDEYVKSLTSDAGWATLARYKITDKLEPLAGFLATCAHETAGFHYLRELLNYTPQGLRRAWPNRFGNKSDAELIPLCRSEKALAAAVYNGRMGNRPGTDDGYNFRGAGYLQITGRDNFVKYGKLVGIDFSTDPPPSTDDTDALLVMAAALWAAGRCNELCEGGNFPGACAVINVGNASLVSKVLNMEDREKWFQRILKEFGKYENVLESPLPQAPPDGAGTAPTHGVGATPAGATRGFSTQPVLRPRAVQPATDGHWYDGFTRWFRSSDEDTPAAVLHPDRFGPGDPNFRHPTDIN